MHISNSIYQCGKVTNYRSFNNICLLNITQFKIKLFLVTYIMYILKRIDKQTAHINMLCVHFSIIFYCDACQSMPELIFKRSKIIFPPMRW